MIEKKLPLENIGEYVDVDTSTPKDVDFRENLLWNWWDMYEFKAYVFVQIADLLTSVVEICARNGENILDNNECSVFKAKIDYIVDHCKTMGGLDTSILCATELRGWIDSATNQNYKTFGSHAEVLRDTIRRELQSKFTFTLSAIEADHYTNFRKGWENVYVRFSAALSDIEEARKCFALNRYAASVFHSTQIVEIALIELGKFIKVKDPKSGWTAVSNALRKIVNTAYKDRTAFEKKHFEFLEQAYGTVEALKNAWRNKVSHAQGRLVLLTTDFTPGITEEIIFATRAFTSRLASGLPPTKNSKDKP